MLIDLNHSKDANFPKTWDSIQRQYSVFLDAKVRGEEITRHTNFSREDFDGICGLENRGYLFGIAIAIVFHCSFLAVLIEFQG